MSSFLAIRDHVPPIVVGNSTFDLLFGKIKSSASKKVGVVLSANPIADTMGYLNLKHIDGDAIAELVPLVEELIEERRIQSDCAIGTGFDVMADLVELRSKLLSAVRLLT